jgi:hypothetical protein
MFLREINYYFYKGISMRHIRISNASKVEAEISARSYKKLCEKLKGYNKQMLWKVMDHYLFHTMEDHHVEELLKILDTFNKTKSFEEPPAPVEGAVEDSSPITDKLKKQGMLGNRYPKSKRKLSDNEISKLDKLFHSLNRMSRYTDDWRTTCEEINKILGYEVVANDEEVEAPLLERRMEFTDPITAEDLESSKDRLDLLYDVNYFTYLTPATAQANAKKLIQYAEEKNYPAPAHWHFIAASENFLDLEEEEGNA